MMRFVIWLKREGFASGTSNKQMEQLDLDLSASKAPVVSDEEIRLVVEFLADRGWQKAAAITAALGFNERRIRAIAEQSDGLILSGPGCPGYRLLTAAVSFREIDMVAGRIESQSKRMRARAISIRCRAHALISRS